MDDTMTRLHPAARSALLTILLSGAVVSVLAPSDAGACPPRYVQPSAEEIRASKADTIFSGRVLEIASVERETRDDQALELLALTVLTRDNLKGEAPVDRLVTIYVVVDADRDSNTPLRDAAAHKASYLPASANVLPAAPRELDELLFFARPLDEEGDRYALCENAQFYAIPASERSLDDTRRAITRSARIDEVIIY